MKKLVDFNINDLKESSIEFRAVENTIKEIAIVGIAAKLPMADDTHKFWENLRKGTDCIREIPESRKKDIQSVLPYMELVGTEFKEIAYLDEIDKFDYSFFGLSPKEAGLMDPNQRLFLENTWKAIEDSGYGGEKIIGTNTGVYVGFGGEVHYYNLVKAFEPTFAASMISSNLAPIIASRIAYILDLKGPSMLIDTACSSSLVAVHMACQGIRNRECDMAIAGGVKIVLSPLKVGGGIGIESSDGRTRAFDDSSDGTGWGEGVATVVLKPLSKAIEDRDNIYAVIKGSAVNQDGSSVGITAPNPEAQEEVIIKAWKNSGVDPETITYIEAHGTGTKLGDPIEIEGIQRAFRRYTNKKHFCSIGSVKTNIGHLDNAAGIAGLIKAVLSLKNKELPPSLHFKTPNSKVDFVESPVHVNDKLKKWETDGFPRRCGVSSFGLSGTNCHVILEEAAEKSKVKNVEGSRYNVLALSAKSKNSLEVLVKSYYEFLEKNKDIELEDICYTANTGRGHYNHRLAIKARSKEDLKNKLGKLIAVDFSDFNDDEVYYGQFKDNDEAVNKDVAEIIRELNRQSKENSTVINEICKLYIRGGNIVWNELYKREKHDRISLPTYPFERKRCWVEVPYKEIKNKNRGEDEKNMFYKTYWEIQELEKKQKKAAPDITLIFSDNCGKGSYIADRLREYGRDVIEVEFGKEYNEVNTNRYVISGEGQDYLNVLKEIKSSSKVQIVHLMTLSNRDNINSKEELEECLKRGVYSLFHIVKAITNDRSNEYEIVIITENANEVTGQENILSPENSTLLGLGKTIVKEYPNLICRCIDTDRNTHIDAVLDEIDAMNNVSLVGYRNGKRYVELISKVDIADYDDKKVEINEDGAYIITGGTGGIGVEVAKYLASKSKVNLVLINRTKLPDRSDWDKIIEKGENEKLCKALESIIKIEESGSAIKCFSADVSDEYCMKEIINTVREGYGKINGIIHAAGVAGDGFIINREIKEFREVLLPKVNGTWILDNLTLKDDLDFFIMFSSLMSVIGAPGQGDYTSANSYLDSYQAYRKKDKKKTLTINWTGWKQTGMALDHGINDEGVFKLLNTDTAVKAFENVLNKDISRIAIGQINTENKIIGEDKSLYLHGLYEWGKIDNTVKNATEIKQDQKPAEVRLKGEPDGKYAELEKTIAGIMGSVLGLEEIDINDDFFELGGHSLNATLLLSRIHKEMSVEIPLIDFFDISTVKSLKEYILEAKKSSYLSIEKTEIKDYYPMSPAQKRMYILNQLEGESPAYNITGTLVIEGQLDIGRFEDTFKKLIERHETLRTSFIMLDENPVQKINEDIEFNIEYFEEDEGNVPERIKKLNRPFDLKNAPLFRVSIIKVKKDRHIMVYSMHHIISDGVSMSIIIKDFSQIYNGMNLPELRIQYKDYGAWQNKLFEDGVLKKQEEYWREVFKEEIPVLNFPLDHIRPAVQNFEGDSLRFETSSNIKNKIAMLARETGSTVYMVLLAAYNGLLMKYTGQEDIIVGTPISGRQHPDLDGIVGMFVNTLAMRNKPCRDKTFREFLSEVKDNALKAYENQDYPFEELVEKLKLKRDMSRNPLFSTMFSIQNSGNFNLTGMEGLSFKGYRFDTGTAIFDISIDAQDVDDKLIFKLEYASKLFKKESMERLASHFLNLLSAISENLDVRIGDIEILSEKEKEKILYGFNGKKADYELGKALPVLFEEWVDRFPQKNAILFDGKKTTYKDLDERSNQVARCLLNKGIQKEDIVAVALERTALMVESVLGIWKAQGAYMPLDINYPPDRILTILEESRAKVLITLSTNIDNDVLERYKGSIICVDLAIEEIRNQSSDRLGLDVGKDTLAYVLFTSGSTGKPKGVMIEHIGMLNHILAEKEELGLDDSLVFAQNANQCFDISVWQLFGPLALGGTTSIYHNELVLEVGQFIEKIVSDGVTLLEVVPSYLSVMLDYIEERKISFKTLKHLMITGESASPGIVRRWFDTCPGIKMVNAYGPAEASDDVTQFIMDSKPEDIDSIPIGKPLGNINVYICDDRLNLCPVGVVGEIAVSGICVGRGYINNPDMSLKSFAKDPYSKGDVRLYRTGDLGRWLTDGILEFHGRKDYQVKIRGYRIELGEIESRLLEYEGIKEVAVIDREDNKGGRYLCAYFTSGRNIDIGDIKEQLLKYLPEYMVPSYFVQLEKLPLSTNGKLDRKVLPKPDIGMDTDVEYRAPENEVQKKLAKIWSEVLGADKPGINENFFDVGGHSLKATVLVSRIHKEMNVEIPLKAVFEAPTIKGMAEYVSNARESIYRSIQPFEKKEFYPLSSAQRRLFILNQLESGGIAYNLPGAVIIEGRLDKGRFEEAFRKLISRHETLRTSFNIADGEPVQVVHENIEFNIEYFEEKEDNARDIAGDFVRPFDLTKAPLMRVALIKLKKDKHIMLSDMHHIISDGVSADIITKEFISIYKGYELPELKIQYRDYAMWQNTLFKEGAISKQEEYWKKVFEEDLPVLDLQTDYARPVLRSFEGGSVEFEIGIETKRKIDAMLRETETTLYMVILAAYNTLLMKYTGQEDIIIGSPIAGRPHADLENLVGMFVNTLAMRNRPCAGKTFAELLCEVKENALSAYTNQDYQFEKLIEELDLKRDTGRNPLFDAMLVLQNTGGVDIEVEGLKIKPYKTENNVAKYDLSLIAAEDNERIYLRLEYFLKLFKKETIERMADHLVGILDKVAIEPDIKLSDIDMLPEGEKQQLLFEFNRTGMDYSRDKTIHELFEEQVEKSPENKAVIFMDEYLTYGELNKKSNGLAKALIESGAKTQDIVAVMMKPSFEMIISILGVLKSGGAYLPVDPDYPEDRIKHMLTDSGSKILITSKGLSNEFEFAGQIINPENIEPGENIDNLPKVNGSEDLAYIIYTSGSTGKPKGVMVEHRGLVNFITWRINEYEICPNDKILQLISVSFDGFGANLYSSLLSGGCLVLPAAEMKYDYDGIRRLIKNCNVTNMSIVPQMLRAILDDADKDDLASLKSIVLAGEKSDKDLLNLCKDVIPEVTLINEYGPTENTITTTALIGLSADKSGIIGKPIANNKVYILDKNNKILPVGVPGELCISGDGLARGYFNRKDLTDEKFINNPFIPEERMYKTGDLARWLTDGNIEFLGRVDQQVKIRGYRVELGEIESELLKHPAVNNTVVLAKENQGREKYICAYFTGEREVPVSELREHLSSELPDYMIPSYFIQLDKIPLTQNGKIDNKALPKPDGEINSGAEYEAPRTEQEIILTKIWEEVLMVNRIGINDEFLNVGGDSIKALKVMTEAKKHNINLAVLDIFKYKTIANILKNINKAVNEKDSKETEEPQEEKIVRVDNFRETPDFYSVYSEDIKELEIEMQRDVTIYLYRSLPLCVILADPNLHPWFYENYINIYSTTNSDGLIELDYLELWANYSHVIGEVSLGADVIENVSDIINFITNRIDKRYYVNIAVDEFYLPGKEKYQKIHYIHEVLVYGYDNVEKRLKTVGFDESGIFNNIDYSYNDFGNAYEKGKKYYDESAPWAREVAVHLFYHKGFKRQYPFNIKKFLNRLNNYINSIGDEDIIYTWSHSEDHVHYGMDVYDDLANHLKNSVYGKAMVDYRAIHLLAEHKRVISKRLDYIISEFGLEGKIISLYEEYLAFAQEMNTLRLKAYEFQSIVSGGPGDIDQKEILNNINSMVNSVTNAKKKEFKLLGEIYTILSSL